MLPAEQHFAEKIHAYTLPRQQGANTRVKDLVDLVLLIKAGLPEPQVVALALRATFERRKTHIVPATLPPPPEVWQEQYPALAAEANIIVPNLHEAYSYILAYWQALPM